MNSVGEVSAVIFPRFISPNPFILRQSHFVVSTWVSTLPVEKICLLESGDVNRGWHSSRYLLHPVPHLSSLTQSVSSASPIDWMLMLLRQRSCSAPLEKETSAAGRILIGPRCFRFEAEVGSPSRFLNQHPGSAVRHHQSFPCNQLRGNNSHASFHLQD